MSNEQTTPKRKHGPNVWVIHYRGRYSVKEAGSPGYLVPPVPQRIAIAIARLIARANRSELIIQGERGRIRARDSHGADPHPPKG
jgi:hypothetical protein